MFSLRWCHLTTEIYKICDFIWFFSVFFSFFNKLNITVELLAVYRLVTYVLHFKCVCVFFFFHISRSCLLFVCMKICLLLLSVSQVIIMSIKCVATVYDAIKAVAVAVAVVQATQKKNKRKTKMLIILVFNVFYAWNLLDFRENFTFIYTKIEWDEKKGKKSKNKISLQHAIQN